MRAQERYRHVAPRLQELVARVKSAWFRYTSGDAARLHLNEDCNKDSVRMTALSPSSMLRQFLDEKHEHERCRRELSEQRDRCCDQQFLIMHLQSRCRQRCLQAPKPEFARAEAMHSRAGGLLHAGLAHSFRAWRMQSERALLQSLRSAKRSMEEEVRRQSERESKLENERTELKLLVLAREEDLRRTESALTSARDSLEKAEAENRATEGMKQTLEADVANEREKVQEREWEAAEASAALQSAKAAHQEEIAALMIRLQGLEEEVMHAREMEAARARSERERAVASKWSNAVAVHRKSVESQRESIKDADIDYRGASPSQDQDAEPEDGLLTGKGLEVQVEQSSRVERLESMLDRSLPPLCPCMSKSGCRWDPIALAKY